jgi:hypothetical protein
MNRSQTLLLCITALCLLTSFSEQTSTEKKGFRNNFWGTLNGEAVDNIAINGQIDNIKFYTKPEKTDANPSTNYTKSGLHQIKQITIPANARRIKYDTKTYIDVLVNFKEGGEKPFIVETNRKIVGEKKDKTGTIELFFDENGLKTAEIKGVECNGQLKAS